MRIRIDLKIFIFLILFWLTKQIQIYAIIMLFCIIHEIGHIISGLLLRMKPEKLEITPFGVSVHFKLDIDDYNKKIKKGNRIVLKKIIIALAGPLTNFILIVYFLISDIHIISKEILVFANLLIMIFNLLPLYPLDGGRILKGILNILLGAKKAMKYTNTISNITIIIFTMISSILIFYLKNIAILLIVLFLWILTFKENKRYNIKMKIYKILNSEKLKKEIKY